MQIVMWVLDEHTPRRGDEMDIGTLGILFFYDDDEHEKENQKDDWRRREGGESRTRSTLQ